MNPEWRTPKALFDKIDAVFHFDLDVAATAENALCRNYFTAEDDALTRYWAVTEFTNEKGDLCKCLCHQSVARDANENSQRREKTSVHRPPIETDCPVIAGTATEKCPERDRPDGVATQHSDQYCLQRNCDISKPNTGNVGSGHRTKLTTTKHDTRSATQIALGISTSPFGDESAPGGSIVVPTATARKSSPSTTSSHLTAQSRQGRCLGTSCQHVGSATSASQSSHLTNGVTTSQPFDESCSSCSGCKKSTRPAVAFCNPPYSRGQLEKWTRKAVEQSQLGALVVGLIPSVTDTAFWHDYVLRSSVVVFLRGRVKFDGPKAGTPTFGSALVIWTRDYEWPTYETWDWKRDEFPPQLRSFAEPFAVDNRQQRFHLALSEAPQQAG